MRPFLFSETEKIFDKIYIYSMLSFSTLERLAKNSLQGGNCMMDKRSPCPHDGVCVLEFQCFMASESSAIRAIRRGANPFQHDNSTIVWVEEKKLKKLPKKLQALQRLWHFKGWASRCRSKFQSVDAGVVRQQFADAKSPMR